MMKSPPGVPHSFWMAYVAVENADRASERAAKLGGKIMVPPTDIPNVGRFACWSDPQQARDRDPPARDVQVAVRARDHDVRLS